MNGHGRRFRTVVPRQCRVQSFHQGWTWQPRVQGTRVVRKAETTAGEAAGTRSSVFVAVEVCARTLPDCRLRWRVSTEGALGSACWRGPARRKNRRESTRGDQLGGQNCKDRYVCSRLGERCLLEQLCVARVRTVQPLNIDIFFCKVDPAWLLRRWNRESATCREFHPRALRGQSFPCPAVGDRRSEEMVLARSGARVSPALRAVATLCRWSCSVVVGDSGRQQRQAGGGRRQAVELRFRVQVTFFRGPYIS